MSAPISVVIPTIGRETLDLTLESFARDLTDQDHVIVMADGANEWVSDLVYDFSCRFPAADWTYAFEPEILGTFGHPLTNIALNRYVDSDSWVWRLDDDDIAAEGALDALRSAQDDPWSVFRMTFGPGHYAEGITIWREPRLRHGDVGTPMFFAPLCSARFGLEYSGDFVYAQALEAMLGPPVFREEVVCVVRPEPLEEP